MIRIVVEEGDVRGRVVERAGPAVSVGRAPGNDVHLPDWHISGNHGEFQVGASSAAGTGVLYRDLHSTNGSRVLRGRETVLVDAACGFAVELLPGDKLVLGDARHPVVLAVDGAAMRAYDPAVAGPLPKTQPGAQSTGRPDEGPDETRVVAVRPVDSLSDVEETVGREPGVLRALYHSARSIGGALDLDEVLDAVADSVFGLLGKATHLTVVLRDESEASAARAASPEAYVPVTTRVRGVPGPQAEAIPVARSVFRRVVEQRAAVLAADALREMSGSQSMLGARILSTMAAPLWKGEEILGVLQVDNRATAGMFREADLDLLAVLAQSASLAVANARLLRKVRASEASARVEAGYLKRKEQRRVEGILGDSAAMRELFGKLQRVVDTRVTVLIEGETGTGKELVANAIHYQSRRKDKLFVVQNCAAMPETLLESELFGHKRGAFTGADSDRKGLVEVADGGTLFLDEIGEMSLGLQAKLLRFLQEGEVRPLGSTATRTVDVRVVAATNRNLEQEVAQGRFRQDLFFRLQVFPLRIPALRERRDDVPLLANHFLKRYAGELGRPVAGFSQQALELLMAYAWPGNVRELENEVQRLVIQVEPGSYVGPDDLSPRIRKVDDVMDRMRPPKGTLKDMVEHLEKLLLLEALREHGGNKSATAKDLGITREGLHKKLRGYGIG